MFSNQDIIIDQVILNVIIITGLMRVGINFLSSIFSSRFEALDVTTTIGGNQSHRISL
jgi:hypothetical protein